MFIILDDWLAIKIITTDKYAIEGIYIIHAARQAIFLQKVLSELKTLKFNNIQADLELNQEGCL